MIDILCLNTRIDSFEFKFQILINAYHFRIYLQNDRIRIYFHDSVSSVLGMIETFLDEMLNHFSFFIHNYQNNNYIQLKNSNDINDECISISTRTGEFSWNQKKFTKMMEILNKLAVKRANSNLWRWRVTVKSSSQYAITS